MILFIHNLMPKWPLCRIFPSHKSLPKNSQSNDSKLKTPDSYSTGLTLYTWFFPVVQNWKRFPIMFIEISTGCLLLKTNSRQNSRWRTSNLQSLKGDKALEKKVQLRPNSGYRSLSDKNNLVENKRTKRWMGRIRHMWRQRLNEFAYVLFSTAAKTSLGLSRDITQKCFSKSKSTQFF